MNRYITYDPETDLNIAYVRQFTSVQHAKNLITGRRLRQACINAKSVDDAIEIIYDIIERLYPDDRPEDKPVDWVK
jgi:hypothetical protein